MRTCSIDGCENPHDARGYCGAHYRRWRNYGDPLASRRPAPAACSVDDCDRAAKLRGMCPMHYRRVLRTGSTASTGRPGRGARTAPPTCTAPDCDRRNHGQGYCQGHYLRVRKDGQVGTTAIRDRVWQPGVGVHVDGAGYVVVRGAGTGGRGRHEHRIVMEELLGRPLAPGEEVHHRNGVRHDNRPENLELWTKSQPAGRRVEDAVEHAIETLQRYAPHLLAEASARH